MEDNQLTVDHVNIRMYRPGTGDFFLLTFKTSGLDSFKLMIDCGCIYGSKAIFTPMVEDLVKETLGEIDLLVVTHEHADHINGFDLLKDEFDKIKFKKVWLAWTEDPSDAKANSYREKISEMKIALGLASKQLAKLKNDGYYSALYRNQYFGEELIRAKTTFIDAIGELEMLNYLGKNRNEATNFTILDLLKGNKIVKEDTIVEFLRPNELHENIQGLPGIRFFVLGPPHDYNYLKLEERHGETYEKRARPSNTEAAFVNLLSNSEMGLHINGPFDSKYESDPSNDLMQGYLNQDAYRKIDDDWLYSAGSLGLKLQKCINNTSLALGIQFISSQKVLLFPGDAEFGSWLSWEEQLSWTISNNGTIMKVNLEYLLNNTIFYKVSHHLSQNGTPGRIGILNMTHQDLQAMVTLDLTRIMSGWKNTMPNDFIGAELINRTQGKVYFSGSSKIIVDNIKTDRLTFRTGDISRLANLNGAFDGKMFIDLAIDG